MNNIKRKAIAVAVVSTLLMTGCTGKEMKNFQGNTAYIVIKKKRILP